MTAYSFKQQFAAPILSGAKRQTIRADRKRHARAGEQLQLYTGMRTKQCRLIGRAVCQSVLPITLDFPRNLVSVGGETFSGWFKLDRFAISDGFDGWLSMREFWRVQHEGVSIFSGMVIRWERFEAVP